MFPQLESTRALAVQLSMLQLYCTYQSPHFNRNQQDGIPKLIPFWIYKVHLTSFTTFNDYLTSWWPRYRYVTVFTMIRLIPFPHRVPPPWAFGCRESSSLIGSRMVCWFEHQKTFNIYLQPRRAAVIAPAENLWLAREVAGITRNTCVQLACFSFRGCTWRYFEWLGTVFTCSPVVPLSVKAWKAYFRTCISKPLGSILALSWHHADCRWRHGWVYRGYKIHTSLGRWVEKTLLRIYAHTLCHHPQPWRLQDPKTCTEEKGLHSASKVELCQYQWSLTEPWLTGYFASGRVQKLWWEYVFKQEKCAVELNSS